ncbi:MAG: tetratricopeptide repeat protein, partial [Candidatus Viridilinea halotolerans]
MAKSPRRRPLHHVRLLIIGLGSFIAVALAFMGIISQLYADELRLWLDPLLLNTPLPWVIAALVVVALVYWGAEWLKQQEPPPAPLATGGGELQAVAHLDGDLASFRQRTGFVDAARHAEIAQITKDLREGIGYVWWVRLLKRLTFGRFAPQKTPSLVLLSGLGGIGKTSLAQRVAYAPKIKRHYPDGRYHFDFNGLYADHHAENTQQALRRLLRAMWLDDAQLNEIETSDLRGKAYRDRYHKQLQNKRSLLILDDPPEQVDLKALMPPPGCGVIFVARPGHAGMRRAFTRYVPLHIAPIATEQSITLMQQEWQTDFDPQLAAEFARICSNIPLALMLISKMIQAGILDYGSNYAQTLLHEIKHEQSKHGFIKRFFDRLSEFISDDRPGHQQLDQVLRLSYDRLSPAAQAMFRSLAICETRSFTAALAQALSAEQATADDNAAKDSFDQIKDRGLIVAVEPQAARDDRGLVVEPQADAPQRYELYDLIFFYARSELEQHRAEIAPLRARYVAWAVDYTVALVAQLEQQVTPAYSLALAAFSQEQAHLLVAFATLNDQSIELEASTRDRNLLNLVGAGHQVLLAGCDAADNPMPTLYNAERAEAWLASGNAALARTREGLPSALQQGLVRLAIFEATPFEESDAQTITDLMSPQLKDLSAVGLLDAQTTDYQISRWPYIRQALRTAYAALPADKRTELERLYAYHIAQRLTKESLSASLLRHVERGQGYAVAEAMHKEIIIYADTCYWHFQAQHAYALLRTWLSQAIAAAEAISDALAASEAHQRLGDIYVDSSDHDRSQQSQFLPQAVVHYQRVLDAFPEATQATRARAQLGLGLVAERQQQWAVALQHFQRVLGDFPNAAQDTRAIACNGLGHIARQQGDLLQSAAHHQRVLDEFPNATQDTRARACNGLGRITRQQGNLEQAAAHYQRALDDFPHA